MVGREELVDAIAGFTLFADLTDPQLAGIAHTFEEAIFSEGERVLRQGLTGSGFYVILDGEAAVVIDGTERARLARGDFFGEVSIILGESPIADVVALRPLRCLVLAGPRVEKFLVDHPRVMYRMLQVQARRLRAANRWRS
jgi:CRP-like cAMP-binding protein